MRGAAERWLERHEDPAVRSAFDVLKAFPENLPDEGRHWLALREAVAAVLDRRG